MRELFIYPGNGPLVAVLTEALAQDNIKNAKPKVRRRK